MPGSARQPPARRSNRTGRPGRPSRAAASRLPASPAEPSGEASEIGDQRRRDLLEAAYALVAEKGLEGLRTRDIAAHAGVNISTLHYYFGTKEQLLIALIKHVNDKFDPTGRAHGDEAAGAGESGGSRWPADATISIYGHIAAAWQTFQANPALANVLQELSTRSTRDPAAHATFRAIFAGWNHGLTEALRGEISDGRLDPSVDPHSAAAIITSFIMGAMIQLGVNSKAFDLLGVARELDRWAGGTASSSASSSARRPRRR